MHGIDLKTQIVLIWTILDVQSIRTDLNDEQAMEVLKQVKAKHDPTVGVSWETITYWAEELFPVKE